MPKFEYRYVGRSGEHHVVIEASKEDAVHVFAELAQRFERIGIRPTETQRERPQRVRSATPSGPPVDWEKIRAKMPTTKAVGEYIRGLPERRHSHPDVSRHFFGRVVKVSGGEEEHALFFGLQRRIEEARKKMVRAEKGHRFQADALVFGKPRTYRWVEAGAPEGAV